MAQRQRLQLQDEAKRPIRPTATSGAPRTRRKTLSSPQAGLRDRQPDRNRSKFWDPSVQIATRRSEHPLPRDGFPVAINGKTVPEPGRSGARGQQIGGRHGLGISTRSRTHREAKSRGVYEGPGMALLYIAYERPDLGDPHNEGTIENYRTMGRRLTIAGRRPLVLTRKA